MAAPCEDTRLSDKTASRQRKRSLECPSAHRDGTENTRKKPKQDQFEDIQFKVLLRDPSSKSTALEKFLEQARRYPSETNQDIVASYCGGSPECAEIFTILEQKEQKVSEVNQVFQVLEHILVRLTENLPQLLLVSTSIVRRMLSSHMPQVYSALNPENKTSRIKTALRLLSAMVMQGAGAARSIAAQLQFRHKNFSMLLNKKDPADPSDVRTCVLHFMFAFLIVGDIGTVQQVIEAKDFLHLVFPGLVADKLSTLQFVLSTLHEKVVQNSSLRKTTKTQLFHQRALCDLGRLYSWKGAIKSKLLEHTIAEAAEGAGITQENEEDNEDRQAVRRYTHQLLLEVCTSRKHGIVFVDKTYGTSDKNHNYILTHFLKWFTTPYQRVETCELVIKMLTACPDQLRWYLPSLKHSLTPRLSPQWLAASNFLVQIYREQPLVSPALKEVEPQTPSRLVALTMATLLPPSEVWSQYSLAVRKRSRLVRHQGLGFLALVLQRAQASVDYCTGTVSFLSPQECQEFSVLLREQLTKVLPSIKEVYNCWTFATRSDEDEGEEATVSDNDGDQEYEGIGGVGDVERGPHLARVLHVICLYQTVLPHTVQENPPNFPALLEGVRTLPQDKTVDCQASVQLYLLKLLSESDSSRLSWLKVSVGKRSMLYLLMEMMTSCTSRPDLARATTLLLCKLFKSTGAFPGCDEEIPVWLTHLANTDPVHQPDVLAFLEKSLSAVLRDPYTFSEHVLELVAEARKDETSGDRDSGSVGTMDTLFDTILSMDEVSVTQSDIAGDENEDEASEDKTHEDHKFPFSPLVVASITELPGIKSAAVLGYMSCVLKDILHHQVEPLPLCLFVHQRRTLLLDTELLSLTTHWLPKKLTKEFALPPSSDCKHASDPHEVSMSDLLKTTFTNGPELKPEIQEKLQAAVSLLDLEHGVGCVQQILLYLTTAARQINSSRHTTKTVEFYFQLLREILVKFNSYAVELEKLDEIKSEVSGDDDRVKPQSMDNQNDLSDACTGNGGNSSDINGNSSYNISSLNLPVKTPVETLCSIYRYILSHSCLRHWFLWQPNPTISAKDATVCKHVTSIITKQLASLVKNLPENVGRLLTGELDLYRQKIEQALTSCESDQIKDKHPVSKSCVMGNNAFVETVDGFVPWINQETQIRVVESFLSLPPEELVAEDKESLTQYGENMLVAVRFILEKAKMSQQAGRQTLPFSHFCISRLVTLVTEFHVSHVDRILADVLLQCPVNVISVTQDCLSTCLESSSPEKIQVALLAVTYSATCRTWCLQWCVATNQLKKSKKKMQYLKIMKVLLYWQNTGSSSHVLQVLRKTFWSDLLSWLHTMHVTPLPDYDMQTRLDVLSCIATSKKKAALTSALETLDELLRKESGIHCIQLRFYKQLTCLISPEASSWQRYLVTCLQCLTNQAKMSQQTETIDWLLDEMEAKVKDLSGSSSLVEQLHLHWNRLVKSCLKSIYTHPKMLMVLASLVPVMYGENVPPVAPSIRILHQMVTSHSQFLPCLLKEEPTPVKDGLVDLLLACVQLEPECCETSHIAVLLGAYQASLHLTDQKLLQLLYLYEVNKCNLTKYRPYLWGSRAVEHYSVMKNLGPSLTKQPSMEQVVEALDGDRMLRTISNFPLTRKLQVVTPIEAATMPVQEDVYDPCFLLPLFSHLLAPESLVNCSIFMESWCLGLTLATLSSHDALMRGAGYHVITSFISHLEGAKIPEKEQVLYLLELIQNSLEKSSMKLAPIISTFLVKAARILAHPEDPMYQVINAFLLVKPALDTLNVPEFYKLFNSSSLEYKTERTWMLQMLLDGLRETADYRIFEKRYTFKQLLSFHDSQISDPRSQLLVLKIVAKACTLRTVALDLVKNHSILTWLSAVSATCMNEVHMEVLIQAIHNLWFTLLGDRDKPGSEIQTPGRECLPVPFTNSALVTTLSLLVHVRGIEKLEVFHALVNTLKSILNHLDKTIQHLHKESHGDVPDILPPQLTAAHVLTLLRLWGFLVKDEELKHEINSLLETMCMSGEIIRTGHSGQSSRPTLVNSGNIASVAVGTLEFTILEGLVDVITYWQPKCSHSVPIIDSVEKSPAVVCVTSILVTARWCLKTLGHYFLTHCDRYTRCLKWLRTILSQDEALLLPPLLLSDQPGAGVEVLNHLLAVYGILADIPVSANMNSLDMACDVLQITRTASVLNEIFLHLLDYAIQNKEKCGTKGKIANKAVYRRLLLQTAQGADGNQRAWTLAMLIQELCLGVSKPLHGATSVPLTD